MQDGHCNSGSCDNLSGSRDAANFHSHSTKSDAHDRLVRANHQALVQQEAAVKALLFRELPALFPGIPAVADAQLQRNATACRPFSSDLSTLEGAIHCWHALGRLIAGMFERREACDAQSDHCCRLMRGRESRKVLCVQQISEGVS